MLRPLQAGVRRVLAEAADAAAAPAWCLRLARAFTTAGGSDGGASIMSAGAATSGRRAYSSGSKAPSPLQQIPGVGPKTASLLHDHGIVSVEQLNAKLRQEEVSLADADEIVDFLQAQVGVRHRRHANLIAEYVMEKTGGDGGDAVTVSIEGNISVGKSSLIKHMQASNSRLSSMTEFVLEPVERWQDIRGHNILEAFYQNPERYAYTFQSFVFLTRLLEGGLTPSALPQRLLERSVFSDSMVFLRAIHNAQWLSEMEFELLTTYFSPLCRKFPQIVPNGFIYLRADPETCFRRLQGRNRTEETGVSLPYLEQIHQYHEQWFEPSQALALPDGGRARSVSMDGQLPHQLGLLADGSRALPPPPRDHNHHQIRHPDGEHNMGLDHNGLLAVGGGGSPDGPPAHPHFNTDVLPLIGGAAPGGLGGAEVPELIRDHVVYLRGRDGFAIFERIPTLVLDCGDEGVGSSAGTTITSSGSGIVTEASEDAAWNERFARHAVMVECFFSFLRQQQQQQQQQPQQQQQQQQQPGAMAVPDMPWAPDATGTPMPSTAAWGGGGGSVGGDSVGSDAAAELARERQAVGGAERQDRAARTLLAELMGRC